jgi:hypothetical protein
VATDEGLLVSGYAAYFEAPPNPVALAARALAAATRAERAMAASEPDGERLGRTAIELLVDAFLLARRENRACFTLAHRLGRNLSQRYGCRWSYDGEKRVFKNECGILTALHSRVGLSPGGVAFSVCSICGAGDFECDHVPGRDYEGERCMRTITDWRLDEISLVRIPRDPRCYRIGHPVSLADAERRHGGPLGPGERPVCEHCRECYGIEGPSEADLDPTSWPGLPEEEAAN